MSHIFISYSRKDLELPEKLPQRIVTALAENDLDTWVDWNSIPKGEDWWEHIQTGIEEADAFLFLVSPDSAASKVCSDEIDHAVKNGKRILPVILRDTKDTHSEISKRNWIFCRDGQDNFAQAIAEIYETIHTDYEWLQYQTRLQVKALEWKKTNDVARLLRGNELKEAESYFSKITGVTEPLPTSLQQEFLEASQKDEKDRGRKTRLFGSTFVLVSIVMCCAICLATIGGYVLLDRTPAKVEVVEQVLEVRNRSGFRFLQVDVGSTIETHSEPVVLTQDGGFVIVVGTGPDGERPGTVLAYDMQENVVWEYDANSDPYNGPTANFFVKRILVDSILDNGEKQVVFTTQKTDWFPSQLVLLDANGNKVSSYWNSGFIYDVIPQDLDQDGVKELVLSAVNNNLGYLVVRDESKHPAIVYTLSPKNDFTGQTFPPLIDNWSYGTEFNNWVAVFDPDTFGRVQLRIVQEGGQELIEVVLAPDGGYVYLDQLGRIQRVGLSDFWQSEHGDQSPADFICFLQKGSDGWYISGRTDQDVRCPWFINE